MTTSKLGRFRDPAAEHRFHTIYRTALATLPTPTRTLDVDTDHGTARVYRFGDGDGEPLVLLPGRSATAVMWRPNLPGLIGDRPVYVVELLGEAGGGVQTAPIRDDSDQANWLHTVVSGLDAERVHLAGVSIGGRVATCLAIHRPDRIGSLTLLDPAATFAPIPAGMIARTLLTVIPPIAGWARKRFMTWMSGATADPDDPLAQVIDASMDCYRMAAPPMLSPFTDAQLRDLRMPTLVLLGGRSVVHNAWKAGDRARALLPDATVEVWPDATHAIAAQLPDEVNARMLRFLAGR